MTMYDEKAVQELDTVKQVVSEMRLPLLKFRKLNGVLNAIEMQIEDAESDGKVVLHLGDALMRLVEIYGSKQDHIAVSKALKKFARRLNQKTSGQGLG